MNRIPENFTRIVRWGILIFVVYVLVFGKLHFGLDSRQAAEQQGSGSVAVKETPPQPTSRDCAQVSGLNDFSLVATAFLPSRLAKINVADVKQGKGETGAVCGQSAGVRFEYVLQGGKVLYSNMDGEPATVTLGDGSLLRGLEQGILGMKPGGVRKLVLPVMFGFGQIRDISALIGAGHFAVDPATLKDAVILSQVSLASLSPSLPPTSMPLRVIEHTGGAGKRALCGDTVSTDMTVWRLDGSKLFSTEADKKPLTFTIGLSEMPFGIEQAVINMTEGGQRTVIVPAAYVKPLAASDDTQSALGDTALPNEILLVEVRLQQIGIRPERPVAVKKHPPTPASKEKKKQDESDKDD